MRCPELVSRANAHIEQYLVRSSGIFFLPLPMITNYHVMWTVELKECVCIAPYTFVWLQQDGSCNWSCHSNRILTTSREFHERKQWRIQKVLNYSYFSIFTFTLTCLNYIFHVVRMYEVILVSLQFFNQSLRRRYAHIARHILYVL